MEHSLGHGDRPATCDGPGNTRYTSSLWCNNITLYSREHGHGCTRELHLETSLPPRGAFGFHIFNDGHNGAFFSSVH